MAYLQKFDFSGSRRSAGSETCIQLDTFGSLDATDRTGPTDLSHYVASIDRWKIFNQH